MYCTDEEVLSGLRTWQIQGRAAALATVVRTYGSSPRPVGSLLAIRADGAVLGSVSGGCIEEDLIARVRAALPSKPHYLNYGGNAQESERWRLPCGGQITLILEPAPPAAIIERLLAAMGERKPVARKLDLTTGSSSVLFPPAQTRLVCDAQQVIIPHGAQLRLLIIGAVQTARYLAEMALALNYAVSICDPRLEYRATWQLAGVSLLDGMPDDVVLALAPDAATAVVALTHDLKLDDMALMEALRTPAFYVGALGSRGNNIKRRERLALLELAPDAIARLRGPVGLAIGSRTPPEIAVAILADLIAVRNGIELAPAAPDSTPARRRETQRLRA